MSEHPPPQKVRVFLWRHRMLYLGPGFGAGRHRHHAAQLCVALAGRIQLRASASEAWREETALLVPPDCAHEVGSSNALVGLIYLEAEGFEYATLRQRLGSASSASIMTFPVNVSALPALGAIARAGAELETADQVCRQLLGLPTSSPAWTDIEPRISDALQWIGDRVDQPIKLGDIARKVGLSASHLGHLFSDQVGIPLRRYILWMRLRRAMEVTIRGATLTEAAHQAGFADSAHLSRTFKTMFGLAPSFLAGQRHYLDVKIAG